MFVKNKCSKNLFAFFLKYDTIYMQRKAAINNPAYILRYAAFSYLYFQQLLFKRSVVPGAGIMLYN